MLPVPAARWTHRLTCLVAAVWALGVSGCGYQWTGKVAGEAPWRLDVTSGAAEPGLALSARRGLQAEGEAFGLWLSPEAVSGPKLDVRVVSALSEAATIHLHPASDGPTDADSGEATRTEAYVRATSYDAHVVLEARLYASSGELVGAHTATGSSPFPDGILPLTTSDLRSAAMERAIGVACRELAAWAAGQASNVGAPASAIEPPEE